MITKRSSIGPFIFFFFAIVLGLYFTFAAVQGSYGIFRRVQIDAEIDSLTTTRNTLKAEAERVANMTRRLSDDYLDLDLLDERAREVLGTVRPDEIVIR